MSARYFWFGALLGAIIGVLYAPKAGKQTKEDMRRHYFQIKDNILENLGDMNELTQETYESVVDSVVAGYEEAKIITSWEALRIKQELKAGYTKMKRLLERSRMVGK